MFKFYHPQRGATVEVKVTDSPHTEEVQILFRGKTRFDIFAVDYAIAFDLAQKIHDVLGTTPEVSTPDDPALTLAHRMKAVMELLTCDHVTAQRIVYQADYDAEKAKRAAAPQENKTDG